MRTQVKLVAGCLAFVALSSAALADSRKLETRMVWAPTCLYEVEVKGANRGGFIPLLLAAIAPKLIGGVVDSAAGALKEAGERKELARSPARLVTRPYYVTLDADVQITPEHGCLTIARAEFPPPPAGNPPPTEGLSTLATMTNPVVVFSVKTKPLKGEPFVQLEPWRLHVGKFEESSGWGKREREFTFAITLSSPGQAAPFASTTFSFLGVHEGDEYKSGSWQLAGKASAPMALAPIPESAKKAQAKQEAFVAPYVLAADVLQVDTNKPVVPPFTAIPSVLLEPTVTAALTTMCNSIRTHNQGQLNKFALNDERCAQTVTFAKIKYEQTIERVKYAKGALGWAKTVCATKETTIEDDPAVVGGKRETYKCKRLGTEPIPLETKFGYMVTDATIVEARPGSKFAAFLGTALGASKDAIVTAVSDKIIPEKRKAAQEAEDTEDRNTRRAVVLADLAVLKAEQALTELQADANAKQSALTGARVDLIKAKVAANDAYRAVEMPPPYPDLE